MSGWLYAVCCGDRFTETKCGYTTCEIPYKYLASNYARTYHPLTTRKLLHVPDATLAEKMLFRAVADGRLSPSHEIFNLEDTQLQAGFDAVEQAFAVLAMGDKTKFCSGNVALTVEEHAKAKQARAQAKKRRREQANVETQALKFLREQQATARVKDALETAQAKADKQRADEIKKDRQQKEETMKLSEFINNQCCVGPKLSVGVTQFRDAFNATVGMPLDASKLKNKLQSRGFMHKVIKVEGHAKRCFLGLSLKKIL